MANQESIAAPAPLDVDPYWPTSPNGSSSAQSQHPLDDSQIEAQPYSTATAGDDIEAQPHFTATAGDDIEAQPLSTATAGDDIEAQPHSTAAAGDDSEESANKLYHYQPLYNAAKNGDWKAATDFVADNENLWLARITTSGDTPVMVAARSLQWEFVEKLVERLTSEQLRMQNTAGFTVLHHVAFTKSVKTAEILVKKCFQLTQIASEDGRTPLLASLRVSHKDMVWYLALVTRLELHSRTCPFTGTQSEELFRALIFSGFIVIHVEIGVPPPSLRNREGASALNPPESSRTFLSQELQCLKMLLWKVLENLVPSLKRVREAKLQQKCVEEIVEKLCIKFGSTLSFVEVVNKLQRIMYFATISGNVAIVRICLKHFPDMMLQPIRGERESILHTAIEWRQEEIFNLITEIPTIGPMLAESLEDFEDSILNISANLTRSPQLLSVSGAALQMQRELQWFEAVQKLIPPITSGSRMLVGKPIMDDFMDNHKQLAEKGEKWMKGTANSCMIVTTLVATVVFAAVFTVPGGNVGDTGVPFFLQRTDFLVFIIADALALFSSSTSLLMFLSILTARYAPEDFLLKLPRRLIIGLGSLFFAIITMMVAFGAALYIVLKERWESIYIPIIVLGCIPVLIFAKQQVPLFYDMIQSTYGSGVFKKKKT